MAARRKISYDFTVLAQTGGDGVQLFSTDTSNVRLGGGTHGCIKLHLIRANKSYGSLDFGDLLSVGVQSFYKKNLKPEPAGKLLSKFAQPGNQLFNTDILVRTVYLLETLLVTGIK